ncbi:MAG: methylated-DNA--[protein]-cysteine S-methyltransferase [Chloroflexi bacterium]|nr:MAG: methylated-DNA--[protein]-cysteine S-methyltransferase [Chloroflexota bacterium]
MNGKSFFYTYFSSPLGSILLLSNGKELTGLYMDEERYGPKIDARWVENPSAKPFPITTAQLQEYFDGERREFSVPFLVTGTPFQLTVWSALTGIPYGSTISYRDLAASIGCPKSIRAVGGANARNLISIIIPCHRVIGSDGSLTGYGGGLDREAALLSFEAHVLSIKEQVR